jgi:hypothetical protein
VLSDDDKRTLARAVRHYADDSLTAREVMGLLRDVSNKANLAEVLPLLPDELALRLAESVARQPALKRVGYWRPHAKSRSPKDERLPDPARLVSPRWCQAERGEVAAYLRAGHTYNLWRGVSYCRFECGISDWDMGSRCLTDGEWVWPEGLAHYVECHCVRLPDELVPSMRWNEWQVPPSVSANRQDHGLPNLSFWVGWGQGDDPGQLPE